MPNKSEIPSTICPQLSTEERASQQQYQRLVLLYWLHVKKEDAFERPIPKTDLRLP
ncbi:hypothetical protein PGTUg99_016525 [Puccinia graminis f. sp. tritici]|uniref:Uncharacterized protein n=1 Tax=Puccinia graminis f. sp. tritici TaxID=56615 RepID=A0A5B0QGT6_PUCGR|nr:hypothetical protein PGTUg99_016525 [Puccinia graminis f. sp. tritici]